MRRVHEEGAPGHQWTAGQAVPIASHPPGEACKGVISGVICGTARNARRVHEKQHVCGRVPEARDL